MFNSDFIKLIMTSPKIKFIRTEHIYREEKVIASSLIRVYQSLSNSGFPYRLSTVNVQMIDMQQKVPERPSD